MCYLAQKDQYVCQSNQGLAEAVTGVLGSTQFFSRPFYHPRSSRGRFGHPREAAVCAGNFPDSNGISDYCKRQKHSHQTEPVPICRTVKAKERRNKILFINAVNEVTRERAQSFLTDDHIARIVKAYEAFKDEPGFTRVVGLEEIRAKDGNLNIPLYVSALDSNGQVQISTNGSLPDALSAWLASISDLRAALMTILGADVLKEARAIGGQPAQVLPTGI